LIKQTKYQKKRIMSDKNHGCEVDSVPHGSYNHLEREDEDMRLSADIIYHRLKDKLDVEIIGVCENGLKLYRPEFHLDGSENFENDHVYVCSADHLPVHPRIGENVLLICLGDAPQLERYKDLCGILSVSGNEDIFKVFNIVQGIFNEYEQWEAGLNEILRNGAALQELLDLGKTVFENPMMLIGSDFRYLAYTEEQYLKENLGINLDSSTFDPDLLEVFLSLHEMATDVKDPILLTLIGRSTLSVNIFDIDEFLGCITIFGEYRDFRSSDIELCQYFAGVIKQAFQLKPRLAGDRSSMRMAIRNIVGGQSIDAEQRSVISRFNTGREMICSVLSQRSEPNPIPTGYICSMIEQSFMGAFAFDENGQIAAVIPYDENTGKELTALIRKLRMSCGVSHVFTDIYDCAYACYQANAALEEGNREQTTSDVCFFEDHILTRLLKNATDGIPPRFFYPEKLSLIAKHDAASYVSYIETLKVYLECGMSAAETARRLHIHRSSLIDRLNRICAVLGDDLKDPGKRLAMQIVLSAEK